MPTMPVSVCRRTHIQLGVIPWMRSSGRKRTASIFVIFIGPTAAAAPAAGSLAAEAAAAVGPMKITKIEAVRFRPELRIQGITPNWMWVRLHTDTGIVGIGESYPGY